MTTRNDVFNHIGDALLAAGKIPRLMLVRHLAGVIRGQSALPIMMR